MYFFPQPDWSQYYSTDQDVNYDLGIDPLPGWHLKRGDSLLLIRSIAGGWRVYVWNGVDPRNDLTELAKFPEYRYQVVSTKE